MTELFARNFWWPWMGCYMADYMKGCDLCNCTKTFPTSPTGKLMPNRVPNHHWQVISVDLIMVSCINLAQNNIQLPTPHFSPIFKHRLPIHSWISIFDPTIIIQTAFDT